MSTFDLRVGTCGCCEPRAPTTPEPIVNRPSLDAVAYRTGTWASFRRSMLDLVPVVAGALAAEHGLAVRPLDRWTSRRSDDYGMALVEMWATVADVLTFYQERYANRAWLRTADDHDAIRRLAGLLGYRLQPGVAAGTHLAVTVDDDVTLTVPGGLRVQSVPGDGERPQTFEVDAAVEATSALNIAPVVGAPRTVTPLAAASASGTLAATSIVPRAGDAVVLCSAAGDVERRTVAAVEVVDGRPVVRWSRPLGVDHDHAFQLSRTQRVFGHSAPPSWVEADVDTTANTVTWTPRTTIYEYTSHKIHLDGTIDGIEVGSQVLVVVEGVGQVRTVEEVQPKHRTVGPLTGAATAITLDQQVTHDVRTTVVHELGAELGLQSWELPEGLIAAGATAVHVPYPEVPAVADGRLLVLDDDAGMPMLIAADGDGVPTGPGDEPEFLRIDLASPTARALDPRSAVLLGNVAPASHGATVAGEVLGDGAAAEALQTFTLAKAPVTHVSDATAPAGARSTLEVLVDGVRWTQRRTLLGAASGDRVYTTTIDDDAATTVQFGDGVTGARLPTGRGNVVAGYRTGLGVDGNLAAGQIATALDRPTGLRAVHNPLPSTGGVDPETTEEARANAPATVRTFDRAVALDDFADLARDYVGVAKALATWVWDGEERVVHVTVGGEDGASLDATMPALRSYLDLRRDPNRTLRMDPFTAVPFVLTVQVDVDADRRTDDVTAAVTDAVLAHFAYDARAFGQAVHLSDVYHVVQTVEGVVSALVTALDYRDAADRSSHRASRAPTPPRRVRLTRRPPGREAPLLPRPEVFIPLPPAPPDVLLHAPIAAARYDRSTGRVVPAELATLDTADLLVTGTGGLPS